MFLILISLRFFGVLWGGGGGGELGRKDNDNLFGQAGGGEGDKNLPKNKLIIISPPSSNS